MKMAAKKSSLQVYVVRSIYDVVYNLIFTLQSKFFLGLF